MSKIKTGKTINTDLGNVLVLETNGNDAILYRDTADSDQYIYAHNINFDVDKESYVWSSGDYYASLEECMIQVIANKKEVFYDLLNTTQKLHYSTYIKGIIKTEKEIEEENILDSVYEEYMDRDYIVGIFSDDLNEIIDEEIRKKESLLEKVAITNKEKDYER